METTTATDTTDTKRKRALAGLAYQIGLETADRGGDPAKAKWLFDVEISEPVGEVWIEILEAIEEEEASRAFRAGLAAGTVEEMVADAAVIWTTANWTHELYIDGTQVFESLKRYSGVESKWPIYCEGGNKRCDTCRSAESAAESAAEHAAEALAAYKRGEFDEAAEEANAAVEEEARFGDARVYGPVSEAFEAIVDYHDALKGGVLCPITLS